MEVSQIGKEFMENIKGETIDAIRTPNDHTLEIRFKNKVILTLTAQGEYCDNYWLEVNIGPKEDEWIK